LPNISGYITLINYLFRSRMQLTHHGSLLFQWWKLTMRLLHPRRMAIILQRQNPSSSALISSGMIARA
jgi:hypothetical protein